MGGIVTQEDFLESLAVLTNIPIEKIQTYAQYNNPLNILDRPMVIEPTDKELEKLQQLNQVITNYNVMRVSSGKNKIMFSNPYEVEDYFTALLQGVKHEERFIVAFLDIKNQLIELQQITQGSNNMVAVQPRNTLRMAMANHCNAIILVHNHPSGNPEPSHEDVELTKRFFNIFDPLGIKVLDHVIIGEGVALSMKKEGYMSSYENERPNYDAIDVSEKDWDFDFELDEQETFRLTR